MPAFIAILWGALVSLTGSLVGRVLIALGLSVVTYTGVSASLDFLKAQAIASMGAAGAQVLGMLGYMKVGECISIVFSAMLTRQISQGLTSDTVKKWVLK